jgi:multidrug efflux pump subunit AcrA (membrane-fusion protein)
MSRKLIIGLLLAILVAAGAGGGYFFYQKAQAAPQATEETPLQTATVRRGSLVISASGTGSIIPTDEIQLSFENSGKISALNVAIGDKVKAGDVLAMLESSESSTSLAAELKSAELAVLKAQQALDDLKTPADALNVAQAEIALTTAQDNLDTLLNPTAADVAQAELDVVNAQDDVDTAQAKVTALQYGRGSETQISAARAAYLLAQDKVDHMQSVYEDAPGDPDSNSSKALALSNLSDAETARDRALATLNWYLGKPTDAEIAEKNLTLAVAQQTLAAAQEKLAALKSPSSEDIALAEAQVADAQSKLDDLKAGATDLDIQIAETNLASAQAQLALKQTAAAGESLLAPSDGTILSVSVKVGDSIGTNTIITMADLSQPMLEVYVDETDLNSIGAGFNIEVVFDALPNDTFSGNVISVDPSLTNVGGVTAVRALAKLDMSTYAKPQSLPVGLNASVEIINSKTENALLVPVEALRQLSEGKYAVFVMENGEPVLHVVQVGIMDMTYAEITSGLNEGDVVTTGIVETGASQ